MIRSELLQALARENPELLTSAPHVTPVSRLDEVRAAKQLVLCCSPVIEALAEQA